MPRRPAHLRIAALALLLLGTACGSDGGGDDDGGAIPGPIPRTISVTGPHAALVGEATTLEATPGLASVVRWDFGDGTTAESDAAVGKHSPSHSWPKAGTYQVTATAVHPDSATTGLNLDGSAFITVIVLPKLIFTPQTSGTLAMAPTGDLAVALCEDADLLSVLQLKDGKWAVAQRIPTCDRPRTVSFPPSEGVAPPDRVAVACQGDDRVQVHQLSDGALLAGWTAPWGSNPYGVLWRKDGLFVSLRARGQVARLTVSEGSPAVALAEAVTVVADARGLTSLPDGALLVSRWRSPAKRGELARWMPGTDKPQLVPLAWADLAPADSESGGVPSYLDQVLIPPQGGVGFVPGLHANNRDGTFRNGQPLAHDTATRAMLARLTLSTTGSDGGESTTVSEAVDEKQLFEDRGLTQAGAISRRGDWLYLVMRGSRSVERFDLARGAVPSGTILGVGYAPQGVAVSPDGRWLLVDAQLSREVVVYAIADRGPLPQQPAARLPLVDTEPLSAEVLRGKQLFNDSFDTRLADDGYIACAHCHLDGEADGRTWDFTDRGEGLRNTPSLLGRRGTGHGPVHWSANFDEIQDFEHDIRGPFGGSGLMSDADFAKANTTLGPKKAGLSKDLDALAAYAASLTGYLRNPYAKPGTASSTGGGALGEAALRGQAIFESAEAGCTTCHSGPDLTDSGFDKGQGGEDKPRLHDVGTLGKGSGQRLNGPLPGIDTPTLFGLWNTAPYLHDGSAATLEAVVTTRNPKDQHGKTSHLDPGQLADLVAFLRAR